MWLTRNEASRVSSPGITVPLKGKLPVPLPTWVWTKDVHYDIKAWKSWKRTGLGTRSENHSGVCYWNMILLQLLKQGFKLVYYPHASVYTLLMAQRFSIGPAPALMSLCIWTINHDFFHPPNSVSHQSLYWSFMVRIGMAELPLSTFPMVDNAWKLLWLANMYITKIMLFRLFCHHSFRMPFTSRGRRTLLAEHRCWPCHFICSIIMITGTVGLAWLSPEHCHQTVFWASADFGAMSWRQKSCQFQPSLTDLCR